LEVDLISSKTDYQLGGEYTGSDVRWQLIFLVSGCLDVALHSCDRKMLLQPKLQQNLLGFAGIGTQGVWHGRADQAVQTVEIAIAPKLMKQFIQNCEVQLPKEFQPFIECNFNQPYYQTAPNTPEMEMALHQLLHCRALIAGALIVRMGRARSLIVFGIFQVVAILALIPPALGFSNVAILIVISCLFCVASAIAETVLFTIAMERCEVMTAGSDFTIQASAIYLASIFVSPIGGMLGEKLGYVPTFLIATGLSGLVTVWGAIEKFGAIPVSSQPLVQSQRRKTG
jgi:hypothetical protein